MYKKDFIHAMQKNYSKKDWRLIGGLGNDSICPAIYWHVCMRIKLYEVAYIIVP